MSATATVHQSNTELYCEFTSLMQADLFVLHKTPQYFHATFEQHRFSIVESVSQDVMQHENA